MPLTAIFDIGKTNKKFLLFDDDFTKVEEVVTTFEETKDEDGFPCEDLNTLTSWMKQTFQKAQQRHNDIRFLNCSAYGASWVHIGIDGNPVAPLYNYTNPFSSLLEQRFFSNHGTPNEWSRQIASPFLGMLNSGLQLVMLKYQKPKVFQQIRTSLHFPQYCSYLFSGKANSEFTSIGCHTGLWDFEKKSYHRWVEKENFISLFPKIISSTHSHIIPIDLQAVQVGTGIHDSSAALLPYLLYSKEPFLLMSTGTWSITLNPFNQEPLTENELSQDCLSYMRIDGLPVKAARLFLGHEHDEQVKKLNAFFKTEPDHYKRIHFTPEKYANLKTQAVNYFRFSSIKKKRVSLDKLNLSAFSGFEEAYYQLMSELVDLQLDAISLARGGTGINKLFIDGGFARNSLFLYMLAIRLSKYEIYVSSMTEGSALGAAMAVRYEEAKAIASQILRMERIEM